MWWMICLLRRGGFVHFQDNDGCPLRYMVFLLSRHVGRIGCWSRCEGSPRGS